MKNYVALIRGIGEGCKHTIGCNLSWKIGQHKSPKEFYEYLLDYYGEPNILNIEIYEIGGSSFKFGTFEEKVNTENDEDGFDTVCEMIATPMKKCVTQAGNTMLGHVNGIKAHQESIAADLDVVFKSMTKGVSFRKINENMNIVDKLVEKTSIEINRDKESMLNAVLSIFDYNLQSIIEDYSTIRIIDFDIDDEDLYVYESFFSQILTQDEYMYVSSQNLRDYYLEELDGEYYDKYTFSNFIIFKNKKHFEIFCD